jgi:hypothetical protein
MLVEIVGQHVGPSSSIQWVGSFSISHAAVLVNAKE